MKQRWFHMLVVLFSLFFFMSKKLVLEFIDFDSAVEDPMAITNMS
jgi:hypothetical protein